MMVGLSMEYCICFNINQINQLYLSNTEGSHHHIYANDTHREKLCFTQSNTRIWNSSLATSDIFHMMKNIIEKLMKDIW